MFELSFEKAREVVGGLASRRQFGGTEFDLPILMVLCMLIALQKSMAPDFEKGVRVDISRGHPFNLTSALRRVYQSKMRIIRSRTTVVDGRIFFEGQPLNGVLYEQAPDNAHMLPERLVLDGVLGPLEGRFPDETRRLGVFSNWPFESDFPPGEEESFIGLYCQDDSEDADGTIAFEMLMNGGEAVPSQSFGWTASGACCGAGFPTLGGEMVWYEGGNLYKYEIGDAFVILDQGNMYSVIYPSEALFDNLPIIASPNLELGAEVSDASLAMIAGLEKVEHLTLRRTTITRKGLEVFSNSKLSSLTTTGNERLSESDITSFLSRQTSCQWINGDE